MIDVKTTAYLIIFILVLITAQPALPCSGVFMNKDGVRIIGRTNDWPLGKGNVVIRQHGKNITADPLNDGSKRIKWTSKYNSAAFYTEGKFSWFIKLMTRLMGMNTAAPNCGLNEKGLWVGAFWIHPPPEVKYPPKDGRISINDYQVQEYLLDTSASVAEALKNLGKVRVSGFKSGGFEVDVHWFMADASGDSAIIEFPDGKLRVHRNPDIKVITNSFYEHSREYAKDFKGFGGTKPVPMAKGEMTSENRFVFASSALMDSENRNKLTRNDVFNIMKTVTQTNIRHQVTSQSITQWTAVYDLKARTLSWTSRTSPQVKTINLSKLDLSKPGRSKKIDFNTPLSGDITGKI